jgi:hypothetical protein
MSAFTQGPKTYSISAATDDIPSILRSSDLPKPIPTNHKLIAVSSQNGNQSASGMNIFQIATGASAGCIKPNSLYLKAKIYPTGGATGTTWFFNGPTRSASALVNRLSILVSNQMVEQINFYDKLHDLLLLHGANKNYYDNDSFILEHTQGVNSANVANLVFDADPAKGVDVVIPLISGLFSSAKAVPLYLLQSPINVQVDWNTVGSAIYSVVGAGGAVPTGFTVSNPQLIYEIVQPDDQYVQGVRSMMAEGRLFQLNLTSFMNLQTASTATLAYNIGANLSSVKGALWTEYTNAPAVGTQTNFTSNGLSNARLFLDGVQVNNYNIDTFPVAHCELARCLHNMFDSTLTSVDSVNYHDRSFACGINCNKFNNEAMAMTGTSCQQMQLYLEHNNSMPLPSNSNATATTFAATNNTLISLIYDAIVVIDVTGSVSLVK